MGSVQAEYPLGHGRVGELQHISAKIHLIVWVCAISPRRDTLAKSRCLKLSVVLIPDAVSAPRWEVLAEIELRRPENVGDLDNSPGFLT
jgi:hypothetical protein